MVRLYAIAGSYNVQTSTQEASTAVFSNVVQGEYEVEVKCTGYQVARDHVTVNGMGGAFSTYVFLQPEGMKSNGPPTGIVLSPKLIGEIDKGLDAMRKKQYDRAIEAFNRAHQLAPANPDILYLLGTAHLAANQKPAARADYESVLKLEPAHERALIALGELEVESQDTANAIAHLEKAYAGNGADWKTHLLLANAYAQAGRLAEAEPHAERAASLSPTNAPYAIMLLGEIHTAQGKAELARKDYQKILDSYASSPVAAKAKGQLALLAKTPATPARTEIASADPLATALPPVVVTEVVLAPAPEAPWAPPDIDDKEYEAIANTPCQMDDVLARARKRMLTQLANFDKFSATERIEHQEIGRGGIPGPARSHEFNYVATILKTGDGYYNIDEYRDGGINLSEFPTPLASIGLNSLGVAVLESYGGDKLGYRCEGLTNLRGIAAWQIRFEERAGDAHPIRTWRRGNKVTPIPVKGRVWLSATSYDVLRVESDLVHSQPALELDRDHLLVEYGAVPFQDGQMSLWLPWSADMYMQLHGHRYHHKHLLTNYTLFSVDSSFKAKNPKATPPPQPATPAVPEQP